MVAIHRDPGQPGHPEPDPNPDPAPDPNPNPEPVEHPGK